MHTIPKKCTIEGCENPSRKKGWCTMHYNRWYYHGNPLHGTQGNIPAAIDRIKERYSVNEETGCWEWTGALNSADRPYIRVHGEQKRVSRVVYEHYHKQIPEGMLVCHRCDNPKCINPDHLFLGTNKDNMRDMREKGRHNGSVKAENN